MFTNNQKSLELVFGVLFCFVIVTADNDNIKSFLWGTWLPQSGKHLSVDLGVVNSSSTLRVEIT